MGRTIYRDDKLSIVINPQLEDDEGVTILHTVSDMHTAVALLPEAAQSLGAIGIPGEAGALTEARLREGLVEIGIVMHGADNLYYLPNAARDAWLAEPEPDDVRRLRANDASLFAAFESRASEQDLEAAQVGIDDWAVFGVVGEDSRLLSAASIYPWDGAALADVGVLTLASARGNGYATRVLRTVGRHAMTNRHELQYRSQLDNPASIALAQAAGLELFGRWEVPSPDSQE